MYFFVVDAVDGTWWIVLNEREYKTRLREANTSQTDPILICQAGTKKTVGMSSGNFLEVNHPRAKKTPMFWQCTGDGLWKRNGKVQSGQDL